jgi:hypothetical protein
MRAAHHLLLWMMAAGCVRPASPAYPTESHPVASRPEVEPSALVAVPPPEHAVLAERRGPAIASDAKQTLWVGGCNTACVDCSLGAYETFVVGQLTRTGQQLFPNPDPPKPGYACGAEVAIGERVTLIAHSPTEHMVIDSWSPFFASDSCPCAGTQAMTCTFEVTAELAAHHDRIYCGAAWRQSAPQLAR